MKRRPRFTSLSPVHRALIHKEWAQQTVSAKIHALNGDNAPWMVNHAGRILFVIVGAAAAQQLDPELPDLRIVRGAANALFEQAGEGDIDPARRAALISGLNACDRLLPLLEQRHVSAAAVDLALRLADGDIHQAAFQAHLDQLTATQGAIP